MTLHEKFENVALVYDKALNLVKNNVQVADEFAIGFAEWKDENFSMYRDKTCYANTSSKHFDITKYVGKEKSTKYFPLQELLEIYKKEKGL